MTDAAGWGVQEEYHDASGNIVRADVDAVREIVAELSLGADEPPPPLALIVHPGEHIGRRLVVRTEAGNEAVVDGRVPEDFPLGYHDILAMDGDGTGSGAERSLICSPGRCHLPPDLHLGGWTLQLYAMRSRRSWGIGDLSDLRHFGSWAAARGAGFALVNPLAAVAPIPPVEASPYLPTSRRFRNPLYIDVEEVARNVSTGATDQRALADVVGRAAQSGRALNGDALIDRDAVLHLKLAALAQIHAAAAPPPAFTAWRSDQGSALESFATWCALSEEHGGDWRTWPEALHSPGSPQTRRDAARVAPRITFFAWLQWVLERQLHRAAGELPLIQDLPIGVDPGGADVWSDQGLFASGVTVGAPPDLFNLAGQDWSQAPLHPWQLRASGYAPLVAILRSALQSSAGLRIDHVMGLFRLYWIPARSSPAAGVFVRYPWQDILDVLALESVRAGAYVVGEDLGTVEPLVREQMAARDILSNRLLWFEDVPPCELPVRAMSTVTTHDLPTIAGLWSGSDLRAQSAIGVPVNSDGTRELERRLQRVVGGAWERGADEVIATAYAALAASPSMLVAASMEDAAAITERPNMPGTTGERRANWRRALPEPLEILLEGTLPARIAAALQRDGSAQPSGAGAGANPAEGG